MKVLLTGGRGMVGRAIQRLSSSIAFDWDIYAPSRDDLNLNDRFAIREYLRSHSFDLVVHCAAKVGGIKANMSDQVGFLTENLLMNTYVIEESRLAGIGKLIFLGSSCMYPRSYRNPLLESDILAAPLEPTNEGYAIAKISGSKLCHYISEQYGLSYRTFIPCNLYGPYDHFDLERGHLIAAAILKVQNAQMQNKTDVEIWGDGMARREFLYVDDLASFILTSPSKLSDMPAYLNVGFGSDYSVNEYYKTIAEIIGFTGEFVHNLDAPVGMSQKLMSSERAKTFGWNPQTSILDGIKYTYANFLKSRND